MDEIRYVDASRDAGEIAAIYAPYVTDTTITFETNIYLQPSVRGRGIGRHLIPLCLG